MSNNKTNNGTNIPKPPTDFNQRGGAQTPPYRRPSPPPPQKPSNKKQY